MDSFFADDSRIEKPISDRSHFMVAVDRCVDAYRSDRRNRFYSVNAGLRSGIDLEG
jgi:hypothetical protein